LHCAMNDNDVSHVIESVRKFFLSRSAKKAASL